MHIVELVIAFKLRSAEGHNVVIDNENKKKFSLLKYFKKVNFKL